MKYEGRGNDMGKSNGYYFVILGLILMIWALNRIHRDRKK